MVSDHVLVGVLVPARVRVVLGPVPRLVHGPVFLQPRVRIPQVALKIIINGNTTVMYVYMHLCYAYYKYMYG